MKVYILIIITMLFNSSCQTAEYKQKEPIQIETKKDSLQTIANYFLTFDVFINSYVVSDRDIDELYQDHKDWVINYFPNILSKYDLTLYSQFSIATYLYLEQKQTYLKDLWKKHKMFSGNSTKGLSSNEEFKPILNLMSEFEIKQSDLDS